MLLTAVRPANPQMTLASTTGVVDLAKTGCFNALIDVHIDCPKAQTCGCKSSTLSVLVSGNEACLRPAPRLPEPHRATVCDATLLHAPQHYLSKGCEKASPQPILAPGERGSRGAGRRCSARAAMRSLMFSRRTRCTSI